MTRPSLKSKHPQQHLPRCSCGSGRERYPLKDARGIFCAYVCEKCETKVRKRYRRAIFSNPNYPTNEPVEPELDYEDKRNYDRISWRKPLRS